MEWNIVKDLERRVFEYQYALSLALGTATDDGDGGPIVRTAVLERDPRSGLGMQLREGQGVFSSIPSLVPVGIPTSTGTKNMRV